MEVTNETRLLVINMTLYFFVALPIILVGIRVSAEISLTRMLKSLTESGLTRREARAKIKNMTPLPWEVKLLVWLKYWKRDVYYLDNFMKQFSEKKLGTTPETDMPL